jgi:membrane protease YdiL (CAAX protease family)
MTLALAHLLAAYAVLAVPWLGYISFRRARRQIAAGVTDAKVRLYREIAIEQILMTVVVLLLLRGGISAASLGLVVPRSWAWNIGVFVVVIGPLVWSSLRLRPRADEIREKVKNSVGALLPRSRQEQFWFGAISLGAGISEELVFRGFLLYYLSVHVPHINTPGKVLLISLSFGLAHIYQGRIGAIAAGTLGVVFAGIYLMTGSLLLPMALHAVVDARALLIFPPESSAAFVAQKHALL